MSGCLRKVDSADAELLMVGVAHGLGEDSQAGGEEIGGDGPSRPEEALDHGLHSVQGLIHDGVRLVAGCNGQCLQNALPPCMDSHSDTIQHQQIIIPPFGWLVLLRS